MICVYAFFHWRESFSLISTIDIAVFFFLPCHAIALMSQMSHYWKHRDIRAYLRTHMMNLLRHTIHGISPLFSTKYMFVLIFRFVGLLFRLQLIVPGWETSLPYFNYHFVLFSFCWKSSSLVAHPDRNNINNKINRIGILSKNDFYPTYFAFICTLIS